MAEEDTAEATEQQKKGGRLKKFVVFAALAGAAAWAVKRFRGGYDENEWQELPPPEGS